MVQLDMQQNGVLFPSKIEVGTLSNGPRSVSCDRAIVPWVRPTVWRRLGVLVLGLHLRGLEPFGPT